MENLLKYCGAILILVGVLMLLIYHFATKANALLVISLVLMVAGIIAHMVLNKRVQ